MKKTAARNTIYEDFLTKIKLKDWCDKYYSKIDSLSTKKLQSSNRHTGNKQIKQEQWQDSVHIVSAIIAMHCKKMCKMLGLLVDFTLQDEFKNRNQTR